MINLELLNESESIELKLEENSKGGTNNYNELDNKPQINGKTLQGNLTLEDLGIIVNAVKDVLINGTSIVTDGVANIPRATDKQLGLVTINRNGGLLFDVNSQYVTITQATNSNIDNRTNVPKPITPQQLDYAVKVAMTDGKGAEWTLEEQASARARMGIDLKPMLDAPLVIEEDLVGAMNIELPTPCEQVLMLVKQPQGTTSITLYNGIIFDGQNAGGAGNLLSSLKTVPNKYVSFEITVLWNGLIECVTNINSTVSSGQSILNEFPNYVNKKIAKVGLSSISATLPKGTEVMILGR